MRPGQGTYAGTTRNGIATHSYGSWYGSYAFVGGLLTNPTIGWGTNAVIYRDRVGQRFSFTCPAGGDLGTVWGTDIYTDDSSICTAAAHVGIITRATGGTVTIETRPGQTSYAASTRNGIATRSYGSWSGSYVIVGGGGLTVTAPTIGWGANAVEYRGQTGRQIAFTCPAGSSGIIWGTDVYTDDSSICTAAVHAGIISAGGGSVTIEMMPGRSSYVASSRNGVASRSYGSWAGSFRIVGGITPTSSTQPGVVPAGSHRVLTGTISAGDAVRDDGSWYDGWTLQLSNGERVVIAMTSADFDTYLTVVSPSGAMTNDDDGGDGTNSRLELTADRAGSWTIMANTFASGETGSYTLTVDRR